jgi:ribosomal protein L5
MRIEVMDGRVFQGTAKQIVSQMKDIAFGVEQMTIAEYCDWTADNARQIHGLDIKLVGEGDEERAESLVAEMCRTGLATKLG